MNRTLLTTITVLMLSTVVATPAFALPDRSVRASTSTSNALPLLETVSVQGKITSIEGNRIQLDDLNGEASSYRVSESRQQRYGLAVGSEITLHVRRFNNAVISIETAKP